VIVLQPPPPQIIVSRPIETERLAVIRGYLEWLWSLRRCGICGSLGPCEDRDPDFDIAQAEGWFEYLKGLSPMKQTDVADFVDENDLPLFRAAREDEGPFGRSTAKPTPEERMIASLIWGYKGRARPISIAKLRELTGYTERQVKGIVEQLVVTHRMRIGARREEPAGYFIIQDQADLDTAVGPYKSQIFSMVRRLRILDSPAARSELLGQIRLELEGE
jgi:hypothetical protein